MSSLLAITIDLITITDRDVGDRGRRRTDRA